MDVDGTTPGFGNLDTNTWNNANTNWTTDATGTDPTVVWSNVTPTTFDTTGGGGTVTLGSDFSVGGLSLVGPNDLTLSNGATVQSVTLSGGNINVATLRTLTFGDRATLTGSFAKTGDGTLTLFNTIGASAVAGTITISAGTVNVLNPNRTSASTDLVFNGGTFTSNGNLAFGSISGSSGTIQASASGGRTFTINQSTDGNYSAVLGPNTQGQTNRILSYIKQGNATLTLGGINTYDGTMSIAAGTLVAASNSALSDSTLSQAPGATTIQNVAGATLRINSGIVLANTQAINLAGANSTLDVGTSGATGTAATGGDLVASSGGIFKFDLNGTAPIDLLNVNGALTLGGTIDFQFTNLGNSTFLTNTWYTVLDGTGTYTAPAGFTASVVPSGYSGFSTQVVNGNDVQIMFSTIPEPTSFAMLLGGLGLLVLRRRR